MHARRTLVTVGHLQNRIPFHLGGAANASCKPHNSRRRAHTQTDSTDEDNKLQKNIEINFNLFALTCKVKCKLAIYRSTFALAFASAFSSAFTFTFTFTFAHSNEAIISPVASPHQKRAARWEPKLGPALLKLELEAGSNNVEAERKSKSRH